MQASTNPLGLSFWRCVLLCLEAPPLVASNFDANYGYSASAESSTSEKNALLVISRASILLAVWLTD